MRLENLDLYWWLLCSVPLLFLLGRRAQQRSAKELCSFADLMLLPQLSSNYPQLMAARRREVFFSTLLVFFLVLAILQPQWGFTWKESSKHGLDIVIALDDSESMLAQDVKPSRLVRARRKILDMLPRLKGDRVGLVLFAGTAFLQVPLTFDYGVLKLFLDALSPDLMPIKGTNIEMAVQEGVRALERGQQSSQDGARPSNRDRILLIITDGEDFEGDMTKAAALAKENGVRILIMGVGTAEGAPILTPSGYKQDKSGSIVITKLKEDALKKLALDTGGVYVESLVSDKDTNALYESGIQPRTNTSTLKWGRAKRWNEYFQLPLVLALLLLLVPALRQNRLGFKVLLLCSLSLFHSLAWADSPESLGAQAKAAYESGDFTKALQTFKQAQKAQENDYRFSIGQGSSYYRLKDFTSAQSHFSKAEAITQDPNIKAQALYNQGNSLVQLGKLEDAIHSYEKSLKLAPNDQETKDNLEFAKRLLKQKQEQENKQQNQKKQRESKEEQNNQQQKSGQQETEDNKQNQSQNQRQQSSAAKENSENDNPQRSSEPEDGQNSSNSEAQESKVAQEEPEKHNKATGRNDQQNEAESSPGNTEHYRQSQMLLDSVEEKPYAQNKYRLKQGMAQLEAQKRRMPEKDW